MRDVAIVDGPSKRTDIRWLPLLEPGHQVGRAVGAALESRPLHWVTATDIACRLPSVR
jgi:hypothetical protein